MNDLAATTPQRVMISEKCGLISVDVIPVDYEGILLASEKHREQFARDINNNNNTTVRGNQPTKTSSVSSRRVENILAASPSGLWFKMTTITCEPPAHHQEDDPTLVAPPTTTSVAAAEGEEEEGILSSTTKSQLAGHVDQNVFDDDASASAADGKSERKNDDVDDEVDDTLSRTNASQFPTTHTSSSTPGTLSNSPPKTFVVYRSLDHLVWFQRQLLEKEPFLLIPELPVSVETAAEDPLRAIDQITALISTLASTDSTAADPLFWSIITQPDDDFFEMFRGMVYGGASGNNHNNATDGSSGGVAKATALASSLVGAFKRAKAKATGNTGGLVDDNGVPVSGDRAKFGLCEAATDALVQELKSTRYTATDRRGLTSVVAPVSSSLDVADVWWECENALTETNLLAEVAGGGLNGDGGSGPSSQGDTSGRNLILTDSPMGYTLHQSQKDRLLESQLIRRQRRDDELVVLKKRFTEKLLEAVNAHLRLPDTETKPDNLSTMMLASCAIDRAFFSCDKLKEVIASSFFFQNELLRNDDMYFSWGESLVALYKLRVALDGLQEASHGASEAWKEFCGAHYWPYTREKVTEEELKPKLSPRVHTSNRLTHYTLRSANVLAQVSQTEKGIITEGFVSAVTTGAMLAAAHRWRCAVLHQHLHRGNSVMPSARLACGGWGVVAAGGGAAVVKASTSTKLSDQYSHIPSGPGSVLAANHKTLSVGKPSTGLPAPFVANCQKLVTPASGKTGRNLFQLQRDLKKVCEEGNGVAELESLDAIDEDSSTIQDFLDISTGNFKQHCDEVNKQLLYPQLLSSMHEMVLYQKLSWQATEMVAKEFLRMVDDDLFLEALEEDLPFLDNSAAAAAKKPPAKSSSNTTTTKAKAASSSSSSAVTQFGSVTNLFRRRRAAQHEEEEGEEVWRARQERMAAERLHNTHGGQYQGETTTYYSSSPNETTDHTKPRSTSLFTWKKQGSGSGGGAHAATSGATGGGEEMEDFEGGGPPPLPYGGNRNPSTLEAQEYRSNAIRAKVSGLGGYTGGAINDVYDDYEENPFDVPASNSKRQSQKYQSSPPSKKGAARSMSPKFSVNDDDSSWHRGSSSLTTKQNKNRVSMPAVDDDAVFASTYSPGGNRKNNNKSSWKEREASLGATTTTSTASHSLKKRNSNMDDPFGA